MADLDVDPCVAQVIDSGLQFIDGGVRLSRFEVDAVEKGVNLGENLLTGGLPAWTTASEEQEDDEGNGFGHGASPCGEWKGMPVFWVSTN